MKSALLCLGLLAPVVAGASREFSVTGLRCQALSCGLREGITPHQLTTVEVSGASREWAGMSLVLRVVQQSNRSVVLERKFGVMADGKFTFGIPAYTLSDGAYVFGVSAVAQPAKVLAGGLFTVAPMGTAGTAEPAHDGSLAGHWYGISGTSADVVIKADGTYVSGGSAHGTWKRQGADVVFTGPLAAWNQGRGKLNAKGDVIEFYWTTESGAKQYFVIGKY